MREENKGRQEQKNYKNNHKTGKKNYKYMPIKNYFECKQNFE